MQNQTTTCPHCGAQISANAQFCKACGKPIVAGLTSAPRTAIPPAERKCLNCGALLSATAQFCKACGKSIVAPTSAPRQAPPAAGRKCPNCGAALSATAKFCRACGKTIGEALSQSHAPVVPARPSAAPVQPKPVASTTMPSAQARTTLVFALGGVALVCVCLATFLVGSIALSGPTNIAQPAPRGSTLPSSRATSATQSPIPQKRVTPIVRQTLTSKSVAPSNQPQALSWNNTVNVTLPANGVAKPQTLTISAASNPPPSFSDSIEIMDVYEIKLGDQKFFAQPITLELAFDPQKVPSPNTVGMAYWNDQAQTWVAVPSKVDAKRNVVITRATHLTFWTWYYIKRGWEIEYGIPVDRRFAIVYHPKDVFTVGKKTYYAKDFAVLLEGWLDDTYTKYCDPKGPPPLSCTKFKMPQGDPDEGNLMWGFIGQAAENAIYKRITKVTGGTAAALEPEWKRFPEQIVFPLTFESELKARHDVAHELFHGVQARYINMTYNFWFNQWFLEGTADYAAGKLIVNDTRHMGEEIDSFFLDKSLTDSDGAHLYATSHFLDYLIRQNGPKVDFKEMWEAVANSIALANATYQDQSAIPVLDTYLESKLGTGKGLAFQYKQFAQFIVFDPNSPVKLKKASPAIEFGNAKCASTFRADQTEAVCELSLPNYSAKVWSLLPEMEVGKSTRTLKVEKIEGTVDAVVVHLKGDKRIAPPYYAMNLLPSTTVDVSKGDSLLLQVYSTQCRYVGADRCLLEQKVKIKVSTEVKTESAITKTKGVSLSLYIQGLKRPAYNAEGKGGTYIIRTNGKAWPYVQDLLILGAGCDDGLKWSGSGVMLEFSCTSSDPKSKRRGSVSGTFDTIANRVVSVKGTGEEWDTKDYRNLDEPCTRTEELQFADVPFSEQYPQSYVYQVDDNIVAHVSKAVAKAVCKDYKQEITDIQLTGTLAKGEDRHIEVQFNK